MIIKPNPSLGVPIYLQLVEQVKHAIETGALQAGDQLPSIRPLAEELVINANTVAKAYRELERDGVVELRQGRRRVRGRHGTRAPRRCPRNFAAAQPPVAEAVGELRARGLSEERDPPLVRGGARGIAASGRAEWLRNSSSKRWACARPTAACQALPRSRPARAARHRSRAARAQRRRQDHDDQGAARHGAADCGPSEGLRACRRRCQTRASRSAPVLPFVSEDKDLYRSACGRRAAALHGLLLSEVASRSCEHRTSHGSRCGPMRRVNALSRGRERSSRCCSRSRQGAELLILDEPTSGLDPAATGGGAQDSRGAGRRTTARPCCSRRISSPTSIRSRTTSRSSTAAAPLASGALDDVRASYCRIQLVFAGAAPEASVQVSPA